MTLNVSQAPLAPFYFGEPQALKLDIPYYPEDSIQAQPVTASPLTTVGLPWENTLVGSQLSPSDMMDGSSVSALNYSLSTGESLMSTPISNVTYTSSSPVSPNMGRKMSTISTAHSSTWSDAYAGTPRDSPCMSRKMSAVSPARSPSVSVESADCQSSSPIHIDLYVSTLLIYLRDEWKNFMLIICYLETNFTGKKSTTSRRSSTSVDIYLGVGDQTSLQPRPLYNIPCGPWQPLQHQNTPRSTWTDCTAAPHELCKR